jgi:pimeloyl-ACP methyl ester carboxylesterase
MAMTADSATWVLLRGLAREHRHWEDFPGCLQASLPAVNILQPDLPGSGQRNDASCPTGMQGIVDLVRADVMAQNPAGPLYILGVSLGAMVALEWVCRYPRDCAGAVLMNISLAGVNPPHHRLRPQSYWRLLTTLVPGTSVRRREATILDLISNHAPQRERTIEHWSAYASDKPISAANALRQLVAALRYGGPGSMPAVPLLLLRGMRDHLVNPACTLQIANRWGLPLRSHPSAGHDLTLDAGPWVCAEIGAWLERLGGVATAQ